MRIDAGDRGEGTRRVAVMMFVALVAVGVSGAPGLAATGDVTDSGNAVLAPEGGSCCIGSDTSPPPRRPRGRVIAGPDAAIVYPSQVLPGIFELDGIDPSLPHDDLAPLGDLVGDAQVVALGESFHTSGGYYQAKHRLFRYLVEELGFRAFAFESPWTDAELVGAYVASGQGTAHGAVTDGLFSVWASQEVLDLVQWMYRYNQDHPDDPVRFWGFDIQQPWHDGSLLLAYLRGATADHGDFTPGIERCDGVASDSVDEYYSDPDAGSIDNEDYVACLDALNLLQEYFDEHEQQLVAATSAEALGWARVSLISLRAWERRTYHANSARSLEDRDEGMALVFQAIKQLRDPDDRVAIWAHNWHIAYDVRRFRNTAGNGHARNMGSFLAEALGDDYLAVGLVGYSVSLNWPRAGRVGELPLPFSSVEVEYLLHDRIARDYLLVDLAFPGSDEPFLREGAYYYLNGWELVPAQQFRALLYLEVSPPMQALLW